MKRILHRVLGCEPAWKPNAGERATCLGCGQQWKAVWRGEVYEWMIFVSDDIGEYVWQRTPTISTGGSS